MGSIQRIERPKPWRARYRAPDGRQHSRSFTRKVDAEKWLRSEEGNADRGEWVDPTAGKVTYREWSDRWLSGLHSVKPKTLAGYESLLRSRVLPVFAGTELRRITTTAVREWVAAMVDEGLSPARTRQALQVLHASLDVAVDDGLLARNPTDRVKPPPVRKRRQLFLTADQLDALADAAEGLQEGAGALIRFLGYSGLRWGEAVALRWDAVDAERRRVRVRESATEISGKLEWGAPKTHEVRMVIVPRFVADGLVAGVENSTPEGLVFTAPRGGPLRHSNFTKGVWLPAVKAAESVPEGLLIHDLRDTAASLAISAGASIKAVQRMLGHASAAMTLDTYGSLFDEDLEDLADRMQERYGPGRGDNVVRLSRS
ncbi:MAG TPA: tyrosine-type recombinase/integrase [Acidimicrobiia bacterium]|nr:tyrosine-type recombinase/integrase [Acidimicrobiia bacterium]